MPLTTLLPTPRRALSMLAYIIRRLLLIIPTLFGILLINFIIIQAAPGPVEQAIAAGGLEGATSRTPVAARKSRWAAPAIAARRA